MSENETQAVEVIEATALEQLTRGEVDTQVATARRWPRSLQSFKSDALSMACLNPEVAASCYYCIPRAGKKIEGPSVRLAEIVAVNWGNLRCDRRILGNDGKVVTAQATAWDMQKNVLQRVEVQRKITGRDGRTFSEDMIVVTGSAASSIAFRNAVFSVVPRVYVQEIEAHCRRVAASSGGGLEASRKQWLEWFAEKGISKEQVLLTMGKKGIADIDSEDVADWHGLRTAVDSGHTTLEAVFGPAPLQDGTGAFGFKAKAKAKAAEAEALKLDAQTDREPGSEG